MPHFKKKGTKAAEIQNLQTSLAALQIFSVTVVPKRGRWSTEHQNPKSLLKSVYNLREGTWAQAVMRKKDSKVMIKEKGNKMWKTKE